MIPPVAHFIWYGRTLPWAYALALRSAARRGGFDRVCLHHADAPDDGGPGWASARAEPGVELVPLDPRARLRAVDGLGPSLLRLYDRLHAPAARANMLRAAILFAEGGVYLDTDTITIASLSPLRRDPVFVGLEHVALPHRVRGTAHPLRWAKAGALLALRDVLRRLPSGHRLFPRVAHLYAAAANNAILGATPCHPFVRALLQAMVNTPARRQTVRYALGTTLLQQRLATDGPGRDDVAIHPPEVFYPLGPEISEHWFRLRDHVDPADVVHPCTRVIHWYASVRTKTILSRIDEAYVHAHAPRQLFSSLARNALSG